MTKPFDMALFLSGVLTGSKVTQQHHLRQAQIMQAAIQQRWQRDNPWTSQLKHVRCFLTQGRTWQPQPDFKSISDPTLHVEPANDSARP
ncbi:MULTISPECIES: hypothetical protein [unclassified Pseudomonas]|uniref:hypothetical protein n=1 Tax=unclassified Pseudomonas TaxID=196821 RepID=UPI0039B74635